MIAVIIAGGSGTRLWPLSTSDKPKQFLHIDDTGRSLIQQTYDRVSKAADKVYVVAAENIKELVEEHLPEIPAERLIYEPARRGTANAIYLGVSEILKHSANGGKAFDYDEPLFFLWSDHLIRDTDQYVHTLEKAKDAVVAGVGLVQFGIEPTSPSTELGYIERGERLAGYENIFKLTSFKEKPDYKKAKEFVASGSYLWNAGYFMTTSGYMMGELAATNPEAQHKLESLIDAQPGDKDKVYKSLPEGVIDVEFSEKMRNACVIACAFDWADVGNFKDLHAVSSLDENKNFISGNVSTIGSTDSYIRNDLDTNVAIVGLDNVVVVNTPDGLLVASKSHAAEVGIIAKQIQRK